MKQLIYTAAAFIVITAIGCKTKSDKPAAPPPLVKKEKGDTAQVRQKGPIINIIDTMEQKRIVLCIKDSAATSAGLSAKLSNIFNNKLPDAIKAGKLKAAGQPIAWYLTQKAPFFFEAGIPVDKAPTKAIKGIYIKKTGSDSALVAHFFGPYDLTGTGYEALNEMLKDRHKTKAATAYEIYVNNPFDETKTKTKVDPYKAETDIVVPYK